MNEIKKIALGRLRNNEHLQFMSQIDSLIVEQTAETLGITAKYQPFNLALNNLKEIGKPGLGSDKTDDIAEADEKRDKSDSGLNHYIHAYTYHWDPAIVAAAVRLSKLIDQYGNLRKLNYNEETSGLTNKIKDLRSDAYLTDIETINATPWVDKLEEDNQSLINLFTQRAEEIAFLKVGNIKESRVFCDNAYKDLTHHINALITINGIDNYKPFVDKVNYYVDYYINVINIRNNRNDSSNEKE